MLQILFSILCGLLMGWVLTLFGADNALINVLQPFLPQIELTIQHYYVAFGILGLILGVISFIMKKR